MGEGETRDKVFLTCGKGTGDMKLPAKRREEKQNNQKFLAWDLEVTMRMFSLPPCSIGFGASPKKWPPLRTATATEEVLSSRKSRVSAKTREDSNPFTERGLCQQWTVDFRGYYARSWEKGRDEY